MICSRNEKKRWMDVILVAEEKVTDNQRHMYRNAHLSIRQAFKQAIN